MQTVKIQILNSDTVKSKDDSCFKNLDCHKQLHDKRLAMQKQMNPTLSRHSSSNSIKGMQSKNQVKERLMQEREKKIRESNMLQYFSAKKGSKD